MRTYKVAFVLLTAFVSSLFVTAVSAQYDNGSVVGTIRDSTGAPIPSAAVKITNTATGVVTNGAADKTGDYEFPSVRVGNYTVTASATGFADAVAQNILVSVGNRQRIDLTLKIGATETTIQVQDVALQIETETSERGQVITNYQSEAFPLVTRNYSDLLALMPGSRQAPTSVFTSSSNSLVR